MQIKATDGMMHQVSPAQLQRAYKMLPGKHVVSQQEQPQEDMYHEACQYMRKASKNIKRLAQLQDCPETEDAVKQAMAEAFMHLDPWALSDLLYQAMQFEAARFGKKMLKHSMKE